MKLSVSLKAGSGIVGVLGGSCAIAVPVALSYGGSSKPRDPEREVEEGKEANTFQLKHCPVSDTNNVKEVPFGSQDNRNVCWTWENQQPEQIGVESDKYSLLFREKWDKKEEKDRNWNSDSQSKWKQQCVVSDNPSKWVITSSGQENVQHLGLCSTASWKNTAFLKKEEKIIVGNRESLSLWTCEQDCWSDSEQQGIQQLQNPRENSWKKVVFYQPK